MNALLERFSRQQLAQRQFDGERLMQEFLAPARCTICLQPRVIVETAKVPQLEDDKICTGCKNEIAAYSSRFNLTINRAMFELRSANRAVAVIR